MQWAQISHGNGFLELDDHTQGDFENLLTIDLPNLHLFLFISTPWLCLLLLSTGPIPKSPDYFFLSSIQSAYSPEALPALVSIHTYNQPTHTLVCKLVAKKIHSVIGPLDKEFWITWTLLDDP